MLYINYETIEVYKGLGLLFHCFLHSLGYLKL